MVRVRVRGLCVHCLQWHAVSWSCGSGVEERIGGGRVRPSVLTRAGVRGMTDRIGAAPAGARGRVLRAIDCRSRNVSVSAQMSAHGLKLNQRRAGGRAESIIVDDGIAIIVCLQRSHRHHRA